LFNPPEAAILGVGRIEDAAVVRDGRITAMPPHLQKISPLIIPPGTDHQLSGNVT